MSRVRKLKFALWLITGLATAVALARFLLGLGGTTNLSDAVPWGLWIGFDVMGGVALAAGGFIITATVYIFKLERYHSIVRSAVLTAFLGYVAVAVGLLFDLGLPWNIWHMIIFWNPHSPLFEVGWCVMLYLAVLALEFFPVPAEEWSALARIRRFLIKWRLPLVIAGIGLSILHQSSLGSLFLIMPYRLHPLWYSPILPVIFLISAIGLGLFAVIFESHFTAYLYRRKPETELLAGLGGAARWVLILYLLVRLGDLVLRRPLGALADRGWQVPMFWLELALMAVIPAALLFVPTVRRSQSGQWAVAAMGTLGIVLNRIDVGGLAHMERGEEFYLPAWTEFAISAGIVSAAALAFLFIVEHFKVWETRPADPAADALKLPEFDKIDTTWLGVPAVAARTMYSLAFILAASVGFAFLAPERTASRGVSPAPVHRARGGDTLWVDGNLNGYGIAFKHAEHEKREGGAASCVKCHHMNLPRDRDTGCYECHRDMYQPVDSFRHDWHSSPEGARLACYECHERGKARSGAMAKDCSACHKDLYPAGASIQVKQYRAVGYAQAMHQLCLGCHVKAAQQKGKPDLARCTNCHKEGIDLVDAKDFSYRTRELAGARSVLPPY
jgi:Ni/Fe-hydrogenase subunit HybB-like protein